MNAMASQKPMPSRRPFCVDVLGRHLAEVGEQVRLTVLHVG